MGKTRDIFLDAIGVTHRGRTASVLGDEENGNRYHRRNHARCESEENKAHTFPGNQVLTVLLNHNVRTQENKGPQERHRPQIHRSMTTRLPSWKCRDSQ